MAGNRNSGGQNRKATALHLLQGTHRRDRHGDRPTPDPPSGTPDKPATLTGDAAAEWDRMVHRLEVAQTLTAIDDGALYQYCLLFAETETLRVEGARLMTLCTTLRRQLKKVEGDALVALVGQIVALEQLRARTLVQLRQGHMAIRQYLVEFGMTPSARTRVKALAARSSEETPQDKLRARFFGPPAHTSA
jgi:phage terminase small subunit